MRVTKKGEFEPDGYRVSRETVSERNGARAAQDTTLASEVVKRGTAAGDVPRAATPACSSCKRLPLTTF